MSADIDPPSNDLDEESPKQKGGSPLSRRTLVGAAAWSVPVVSVVTAAPAYAASGATAINRTTPPGPSFSADQNSTTQALQATLLDGTTPASGKTITFSISPATGFATLTSDSAVTDGGGVATTAISYGATKPAAGTTFTVTAAYQDLSASWTLTYSPIPNAVVVRVGTGSATLTNASTAAFLEEYSPTGGAAVATVALPTAVSGNNRPLTVSGTATSEGELTRSLDGRFLVLAGYAVAPGTSGVNGTTGTTVNRVVGLVSGTLSGSPVIDTTTALADYSSGNNARSATTTDGTGVWVAGGTGGVRFATRGATTSAQLTSPEVNFRQVDIYDGQLYATTMSGTNRFVAVGAGLPTSGTNTVTNLPFSPPLNGPFEFAFLTLSGTGTAPDTVYVADQSANQIAKYGLVNGTWTQAGVIAFMGVTGIAAIATATGVTIYASSPGTLSTVTDTSGVGGMLAGSLTTLATAGASRAFRGVSLAASAV